MTWSLTKCHVTHCLFHALPDKNICKNNKYQYSERYRPLKFKICIEMREKCQFLNGCQLLTSELSSTGPNVVLLLANRCLSKMGGMSELRSTGPTLVLVMASRFLYELSFHVRTTLFSMLWRSWSLGVNIFGIYCRNRLSFKQLKTYCWKLQMLYWKADVLMKTKDGV